MTIVLDSHGHNQAEEVSPTLTTKCNVAVQDIYSVEEGDEPSV